MTNAALLAFGIIWRIACILTGEIGVVPQAAPHVAQVAMNRLAAGKGFDGWHAIADMPEPWALDAALTAWRMGGDADGNLFALSEADIVALGFDKANWENVGSERWPVWVGRRWR